MGIEFLSKKNQIMNYQLEKTGYKLSVLGLAVILLWIGAFKFTPTEANAIEPLVRHHFIMGVLYEVFSLQAVSNLIGAIEIITALGLIASFWNRKIGFLAGMFTVITFIFTLSFLFTTPDIWRIKDEVIVTDFFILKDLPALGIGIMVMGKCKRKRDDGK